MDFNTAKAWALLFRPWSYTATVVPFLVAAGCAHGDVAWSRWGWGLLAGLLFQATVNLLNTWGDERSGVDDAPGAIRTTPQVHEGIASLRAVLAAAAICAFSGAAVGVALCFPAGGPDWALLAAGAVGFLGATNYSTGAKFKYCGLGVPFVAFLMGPLELFAALELLHPARGTAAVCGTALGALLLSAPIALLVCVILHGNDMRDMASDRAAGIRTTAMALGPKGALALYGRCHFLPFAFLLALAALAARNGWSCAAPLALPLLALPVSAATVRRARRIHSEWAAQPPESRPETPPWRGLERDSGKAHLIFGALYALALALVRHG